MAGIEAFVDPLAGGLVGVLLDTAKKVGGGFAQIVGDRTRAAAALKQYADKYATRYGTIRILGMRQDADLESVYTRVRFLDDLGIRRFASLKDLEKNYRNSQNRYLQTGEASKLDGFTVVNEHQYLMVLGGPGAGKSTFLRRIGLEALKGTKGSYKHPCIPVFIELKQFNTNEIDLIRAIVNELHNFGFPTSHEFAIKLLEQGKLLILFDGLDEVPKTSLNVVVNAIQDFVTKYDKNRYISSCRVAAYRSTWNRFRDIELSNFDNSQIHQFIQNWFSSELDKQSKTSERCWRLLNEPGNVAAKELAHTPLLLTFLCLVYNRTQGFPGNRATLYSKALDILLEEWAAEKRITSDEIYQGLNIDLEKVLLSEIAYQGFNKDQIFFTEQQLVNQIKIFLADTVDKPKYLDGKSILNAIVIQQGILVERAEEVFSFSHLTIQEYLTAKYISQDYHQVQNLVRCMSNQRWREVFLLVSGLMACSDQFLQLIETQALVPSNGSLTTLIFIGLGDTANRK
jgi:predicted NACHT family NTPase